MKYRFTKKLKDGDVLDDRFEVITLIGKGRTARVYRAYDRQTGGEVALKTIVHGTVPVQEQVGRYKREAQVAGSLHSPATARLLHLSVNPDSGLPYLAFELVRGIALNHILERRGPLSLEESVHVTASVLDSLDEAHLHNIVHRDVKPDDLLMEPPDEALEPPTTDGSVTQRLGIPGADDPVWNDLTRVKVRVVDFGLAKILDSADEGGAQLTHAGTLAGTPHYASPEQIVADPTIDHRADIYGAGMLFYRLVAGKPAFNSNNLAALGHQHLTEAPPPLPAPWSDSPASAVFLKAVAKDRNDRYYSAAEMAFDLRAAVDPALAAGPRPTFREAPAVEPQQETGSSLIGKVRGWFRR